MRKIDGDRRERNGGKNKNKTKRNKNVKGRIGNRKRGWWDKSIGRTRRK